MAQVHGHCDEAFKEVENLLQANIASSKEVGASICVNVNGRNVIDMWGGYADEARTRAWEKDTIVNLYSTSKTVTALAALILIDQGRLDVNENVSKYWPEFAANGKQDIKVYHVLSHTSGVSGFEENVEVDDVCNFEKIVKMLAGQAPWWTPGTGSGYHSITLGFLIGELVRRITGMTLKEFVAKEVAAPLGADFQLGVLEKDLPRVADTIPFAQAGSPPKWVKDNIAMKTLSNPPMDPNSANLPIWRNAEIGATNGHGNARSVARILSALTLGGEVDGVKLLSLKTIDLIFKEQYHGMDHVIGGPVRWGIGYGLAGDGDTFVADFIPNGRVCFWGGWGGSIVIMDLDRKITIAYAMNKMEQVGLGSSSTKSYVKAIYKGLSGI